VYGLQVSELIVIRVNTHAEEEAGIATVYNLVIPELDEMRQLFMGKRLQNQRRFAYLDKIGLIFLIARRNYPMHFATQAELYCKLECTRLWKIQGKVPFLRRRMGHTTLTTVSCLDGSNKVKTW